MNTFRNPFEALGDPTRRAILASLRGGSKTAGELSEQFELSKATLSHHFKVLRESGLVRAEKRGTSVVYTLQSNLIEDVAAELLGLLQEVQPRVRKTTRGESR